MTETELLLALLFLAAAALYSSVGHAGASGYIAAMALLGFAPEQMRPTALALNLLVGAIGLARFWHEGHVRWRNVLPFLLTSAPAAYLAAQVDLPANTYAYLLGTLLLIAAAGMFRSAASADRDDGLSRGHRVPWLPALAAGAVIGVLSGLTGTGGAIFLTPLLLFAHWMSTREASGTSVAFVLVNSAMALAGLWQAGSAMPPALPWWLLAVAVGALIGTQLGLRWLPAGRLRQVLAVVLIVAAGKLLLA